MTSGPILVTGSGGKLGHVLRRFWPDPARPVWQVRRDPAPGDLFWDIAAAPYAGPPLAGGVILHLAGGRADLSANSSLALRICDLAAAQGARHVFLASSSAVYAPDGNADASEDTPRAPANDYGRAKARMEDDVDAWTAAHGAAAPGITFLRIGNVFGCDSLIGGAKPGARVMLTSVPGRPGGPLRSYIGPRSFAGCLAGLCRRALEGGLLPRILNIGTAPPVFMADLLDAAGLDWTYAPETPDVIPRLVLSVDRLMALAPLPPDAASPAVMAAEWRALGGGGA